MITKVVIKKMQAIADHLAQWAADDPQDKHYPGVGLQVRIRNNISIRLELDVYLRNILTCLWVADQLEMTRQLEYEADDLWRGNISCFEHKSEVREIPPLLLLKDIRNKANNLADLLIRASLELRKNLK